MTKARGNRLSFYVGVLLMAMLAFTVTNADAGDKSRKKDPKIKVSADADSSSRSSAKANADAKSSSVSQANNSLDQDISMTSNFEGGDLNFAARKRDAAGNDAPSIYASGVCGGAVSGGLSLPGGNASFGKSYQDDECNMRETARMLYEFGERTMAIELLCMTPAAQNLGSCKPAQDYNKSMKELSAQHQMAIDDAGRMEEQAKQLRAEMQALKEELKERDRRIVEAAGPFDSK